MVWALGRLGQRQPLYGPMNCVLPAVVAEKWCDVLLRLDEARLSHLAVMQMARNTGDRYRDIAVAHRDELATWFTETDAPQHLVELVTTGGTLAEEEQDQIFGEALPKGLRVR